MDDQKIEQDKGPRSSQDATRKIPRPQGAPDDYLRVAGDASASPADRATVSRRPVILGALAVLCVALIVGSLGFVHPGPDGGWSVAWLFQTTADESSDAADQGSSSRDTSSKAEDEGDESNEGASEEADDEGTDTETSSSDASDSRTSSSTGGTDSSTSSDGHDDAGADDQAGANPGSSGQSSSSSNGPSDEQSNTITVSVSVSSSAVGGSVSGGGTFTFEKGATAYDALCACGLSVNASNSAFGIYVSAIGGLAEKEHGEGSGWNYAVNGVTPGMSAGSYVLSDGDSVEWFYITG